jgi:hypothetical protein
MSTDTTRRSIIAGIAAAPITAIPAIAASNGLESQIEQHSLAHAKWEAAIAHVDGREEPMLETGLGDRFGIKGLLNNRELCREMISELYKGQRENISGIARSAPEFHATLNAHFDALEAEYLEKVDRVFDGEGAIFEALEAAEAEERAALLAVAAHPVATIADVNRKAQYICKILDGCVIDDEIGDAFIRSIVLGTREAEKAAQT